MALWICMVCGAAYSVDAPACPGCGAEDCYEQGDISMAKISRHGGPSNAPRPRPGEGDFFQPIRMVGEHGPEVVDLPAGTTVTVSAGEPDGTPTGETSVVTGAQLVDEEGGAPSPGNSSETSADSTPPSDETTNPPPPSPAPTMASPSKRGRKGSSTAPAATSPGPADD